MELYGRGMRKETLRMDWMRQQRVHLELIGEVRATGWDDPFRAGQLLSELVRDRPLEVRWTAKETSCTDLRSRAQRYYDEGGGDLQMTSRCCLRVVVIVDCPNWVDWDMSCGVPLNLMSRHGCVQGFQLAVL